MRSLNLVSTNQPRGELVAQLLPADDEGAGGSGVRRLAPSWPPMPRGLTLRARVETFLRELALHLRLARVGFWRGLVHASGVLAVSRLYATVIRADGRVEHLGLIATRLVTDAGVAFLVDDWDNNVTDLTTMNFHGCGTGAVAEAVGDTALGIESTTILNPDSTRATGTRSQPAANQYRSVGTLTFDGAGAITEHGILSQSAIGGVLWDRSVFSAINVASGDSCQFTYTCTCSAGG